MELPDAFHHLTALHRHDDICWSMDAEDNIVIVAERPLHAAAEELASYARLLGFAPHGDTWVVEPSNPYYAELWLYMDAAGG